MFHQMYLKLRIYITSETWRKMKYSIHKTIVVIRWCLIQTVLHQNWSFYNYLRMWSLFILQRMIKRLHSLYCLASTMGKRIILNFLLVASYSKENAWEEALAIPKKRRVSRSNIPKIHFIKLSFTNSYFCQKW